MRKSVVSAGCLNKEKNHQILIEVFAMIADDIQDDLLILGEGDYRQDLMDLIERKEMNGKILLAGQVQNIKEQIFNAKLFVLSSNHEGLTNALMEVMALGISSISTDCPCGDPR